VKRQNIIGPLVFSHQIFCIPGSLLHLLLSCAGYDTRLEIPCHEAHGLKVSLLIFTNYMLSLKLELQDLFDKLSSVLCCVSIYIPWP